jgi:diguanylate cyclase
MKTDAWLNAGSGLMPLPDGGAAAPADDLRSPLLDALVMMLDDEPLMTELTQSHLEDAGYSRFISCNNPYEAMGLLSQHEPSVLLLDLMMPGITGFDVLAQIRAHKDLRALPVIVLTASAGADTKLRALQLGATDILAKPVDPSELVLRLRNTLAFKHFHDRLANYDADTQLPNARHFVQRLDRRLTRSTDGGERMGLLNVTVPECASVRETLGLPAAAQLARTLAERMSQLMSARNPVLLDEPDHEAPPTVARLGVDEFAVLVRQVKNPEALAAIAASLLRELSQPVALGGHSVQPTPSAGIAIAPTDARTAADLLKAGELARSEARLRGGGRHEFFSREMNARAQERMLLVEQLRQAAERQELRLHYQPKVALATGRIIGVEALVRWQHPTRGLVSPGVFIPLAEEHGLIGRIGNWVLARACQDAANWSAAGLPPLKVAINVARPQFESGFLPQTLQRVLQRTGLSPKRLVLELTESMLMRDANGALEQMHAVKALGIALSIDDFGTGYSSFSYLKRFPLNELKIDRSFVTDLPGGERDMAIVRTITRLGHDLGLTVVAEGVETEGQLQALREAGCDEFQGFLFSKPVPEEALIARLKAGGG